MSIVFVDSGIGIYVNGYVCSIFLEIRSSVKRFVLV